MFTEVWTAVDRHVASGRIPGYVGAVRIGGVSEVHAAGLRTLDGPPMVEDTQFRIASLTKPIGGVLALSLVEDGVFGLDDPIATWLPEAAEPRVLVDPQGPLEETVPARRPITIRHLAAGTCGWGAVFASSPLKREMVDRGVYSGAMGHELSADEFAARVCAIPLAFEPGEGWLYDTGITLLGILITRATGQSLTELLTTRVFGPLGMGDTAFAGDAERLATSYKASQSGLAVVDPPDGRFARPPAFEELNGGLVSTAPDLLRFFTGIAGGELLSAESRAAMITDQLTPAQREQGFPVIDPGGSWGLCTGLYPGGAWGWDGGTGTTAHVDPARDTVAVVLTQRMMREPQDAYPDFHDAVATLASPS